MITRLLVANRGEIACRIMRTAHQRGIFCAALYNLEDSHALHVKSADEAYALGEGPLSETYLNIEKIIHLAKHHHIDAIHPGYGFLSENPGFAKACEKHNILFIGPSSDAIEKMGIKSVAKDWVEKLNLPTIPGYQGAEQSTAHLINAAQKIGLPILIKASHGGGGKGMRIVTEFSTLEAAIEGAKRESAQSFGSSHVILEKYFPESFHIEVQVFGDKQGQVVHLFERNCSIQRRYQKIIEESPATLLSATLKQAMFDAAVKITQSLKYAGAGTIEFLVSNDKFYFMEMNTRLQVEHPVTEFVTGQDLVAWQLDIAEGNPLPLKQSEIISKGHAIEARIYCEDPNQGFLPTAGKVVSLASSKVEGIRIDTGIQAGDIVGISFDPMLAKIIALGSTRYEAIQRLKQALQSYQITGPTTNLNFLQTLLSDTDFVRSQPPTSFIAQKQASLCITPHSNEYIGALAITYWLLQKESFLSCWQMNHVFQRTFCIEVNHAPITMMVQYDQRLNEWCFNAGKIEFRTDYKQGVCSITTSGRQFKLNATHTEGNVSLSFEGYHYLIKLPVQAVNLNKTKTHENSLTAPMPGVIRQIFVAQGGNVKSGEKLLIMEAMKMEHTISAPKAGIVKQIFYAIGDQVTEGTELMDFEANHE
jgi:3-methylcrotonyl-CoA carboxylase alpha subunit